jgi:RHS repeat-associated protein
MRSPKTKSMVRTSETLAASTLALLWLFDWHTQAVASPTPSSPPAYECTAGLCDGGCYATSWLSSCPTTASIGELQACSITNYNNCLAGSYGSITFTGLQMGFSLYGSGGYLWFESEFHGEYNTGFTGGISTGSASADRNLGTPSCPASGGAGCGDPINTSWGNQFEDETDFSGPAPHPLVFHRYYNSSGLGDSTIGAGWTHTFSRQVAQQTSTLVQLFRDDGEILYFNQCSAGWCANADEIGTLTQAIDSSSGYTTGWTYTGENDVVESYSAAGQLLSETARGGLTHTLTYDSSGRLSTVTDSFGHTLTLSYNSSNQITQVADPNGALIQYTYDSSNNFSTVTYPDSTVRIYYYNESGYVASGAGSNLLTGIQDESGTRYASIYYDSSSRSTQSSLASGARDTEVTYNTDGSATVVDALGASRTLSFTAVLDRNHLTGITGGLCAECGINASYSYDANGNISSTTDLNGNVTTHSFDLTRNLETSRTEASGAAQARTITTSWSSSYRVPSAISVYAGSSSSGTALRTTSFTYDSNGNQLTKTVTDPASSVSRTWTYTYDSYGRVLTAKGPRTDVSSTTTYTYYTCTTGSQCGQVYTVTDAVGNVTTYNTYNAYGQPLTITDPNGVVTTLTYDSRLRLTSRQVGSETTGFSYYVTGLLKRVTLPDSSYIQYTYDGAHRLTQISDGAGNSIQYTLDALGNRTAENTYDPSSVLHRTHTRVFNSLDELYEDINAAGGSGVTTTYSYDNNGNQTGINAPLSRSTTNAYDPLNRLNQITDPNGGNTYISYDAQSDLTAVEDPLGLTTSYSYNGFGDVTSVSSPDTGTTSKTYDSGGNLATSTDARGAISAYAYDALNRVTSVSYTLSSVTDQTISFGYDSGTDGKGRLTSASDASHSMAWTYDGLGRVTGKALTVGSVSLSVGYGYSSGDRTALVTPSGQSVAYGYNSNHQVTSIAVNGTTVLSGVTYEPFGGVNGWTWGDSSTTSRTFNGDGLISQIVTAGVTLGYSFDNADRITGISDSSSSSLTWSYGYDVLDRLTSASTSAITDGWTYDANGNQLSQTGTTAISYTITSGSNQLSAATGALSRSYSYDAAGNTVGYASLGFAYNNRGRIETTTASSTDYLYNALGQMIEKSGTAGTAIFMQDESGRLIGEYDAGGNVIEETVWLGDAPVATLVPNGSGGVNIFYVHTDHLNTPRKISQPSTETLAWRYDSDPFGTVAPNQNPAGLGTFVYNLRAPGQYYQAETGLNQNYNRDYDPLTAKYTESDLIGLGGGVNTYAYVGGNPVMGRDPSGLFYIPFTNIWIPAGEQYGAQAAQYWADRQAQTGNWLYAIPGLLASLWTPCTSNKTALTLASGGALGNLTEGASLSNFFWDSRSFSSISADYWGAGGANGMSLDHWLFSQAAARAGTIPTGIANAGFNLLELPASWNTWLGFAPNWGGTQAFLANLARLGIQTGVPTAAAAAGAAGYAVGSDANRCGCQQ